MVLVDPSLDRRPPIVVSIDRARQADERGTEIAATLARTDLVLHLPQFSIDRTQRGHIAIERGRPEPGARSGTAQPFDFATNPALLLDRMRVFGLEFEDGDSIQQLTDADIDANGPHDDSGAASRAPSASETRPKSSSHPWPAARRNRRALG